MSEPSPERALFTSLSAPRRPADAGSRALFTPQGADGYHAAVTFKGEAVDGVDTTGWRVLGTDAPGCWCCAGGVCGDCAVDDPLCAGVAMPPPARRRVRGYQMRVTHLQFADGAVAGNAELMGCVSYGQWRYYEVQTAGASDAHLYAAISAPVGGVYAARGRRPTASDYDLLLTPPLTELALSPCDVTEAATWQLGVHLQPRGLATVAETLFTLKLRTAAATAYLGDGDGTSYYEGVACCGGFMHWRVPYALAARPRPAAHARARAHAHPIAPLARGVQGRARRPRPRRPPRHSRRGAARRLPAVQLVRVLRARRPAPRVHRAV